MDEIHHLISNLIGDPSLRQASPRLLFRRMCSSISSARPCLRSLSLLSKAGACASGAQHLGRASVRSQKRRFPSRKRLSATGKRALLESDACRTSSLTGTRSIRYSRRMFPFCSEVKVRRLLCISGSMCEANLKLLSDLYSFSSRA